MSLNTLTSHESTTEKKKKKKVMLETERRQRWSCVPDGTCTFLSNSQQNDFYTNVSDGGFEVSELRTMNGCEVRASL